MNIDFAMVIAYMVITLIVGYRYGKGVKTIKDYALGGRNFNTATLSATVIATWASGSAFFIAVTSAYQDGFWEFCTSLCFSMSGIIVAYLVAPRMREFFGKLSVADVMGDLYGDNVRLITSVTSLVLSLGFVALQLKVMSTIISHISGFDAAISTIGCATVVVFYCAFGGVRSVVFTDVLQFVSFVVGIFAILFAILSSVDFHHHPGNMTKAMDHAFNFKSASGFDYLSLAIVSLIPNMTPAIFQRILMGSDTQQVKEVFKISTIVNLLYGFIGACVGILLFTHRSDIPYDSIFSFMVDEFSYPGMKAVIFIAVISLSMSTLDSHLNAASVIFSHDIVKTLKIIRTDRVQLMISRAFTFLAGVVAVILALRFKNILDLLMLVKNFYVPVVTIPLLFTIFGFRSKSQWPVLCGMFAGAAMVVIWRNFFMDLTGFDSLIPAIIANSIVMMSTHHLLGDAGGWTGPKERGPVELEKMQRTKAMHFLKEEFASFIRALFFISSDGLKIKNSGAMMLLLGVLIFASYFNVAIAGTNAGANFLQIISCSVGALLVTAPLWFHSIGSYASQVTLYSLIYLVYSSNMLIFYNSFSPISTLSLLVNVIACSFFFRMSTTLMLVFVGILVSVLHFKILGNHFTFINTDIFYFLSYCSCALAFILIPLISRQQNETDALEKSASKLKYMNDILNNQLCLREESLQKALNMQNEILRNVNHEIRTPMSAIKINADMMVGYADKHFYAEDNGRSFVENTHKILLENKKAVDRFYKYVSNMLDLSGFKANKMMFEIKETNLRSLLENIASEHDNVLLNYKDAPEKIAFDELKMRAVFEQLIENANKFGGNSSPIEISVEMDKDLFLNNKSHKMIKISVKDAGLGVQEDELSLIFEAFQIGSKTKSSGGGSGIGLAICKEIVTAHIGKITAKNNKDAGLTIEIILPIEHPDDEFLGGNAAAQMLDERIDISNIIYQINAIEKKFGGRLPKVLMVDDESIMLRSGEMMVRSFGYDFMGIMSKEEAVKYIMSDKFDADVILLDMMLCDGTGLDIMKIVHHKLAMLEVPVILQSGLSGGDNLIDESLRLGAQSLMTKPYSRKQMGVVLADALKLCVE
jgi:Na+/proline symporter/signal transduction histidine kinase/CheY-like chemotaxis protein